MKKSKSIFKYAKALFDIAEKTKSIDSTLKNLNILNTINSSSPEFRYFLQSKRIETAIKIKIVSEILMDTVSELEVGLLEHLIDNDETHLINLIVKQFKVISENSNSTIQVTVTTATDLIEEEKNEILNSIEKKINKKVSLNYLMDKSIIGGAKFRIGNLIIDGSVSTRLKKLEKSLYEG